MKLFITGASSGIGEGLARLAVGQGHQVVGIARRRNLLKKLEGDLGPGFRGQVADVRKTSACIQLFRRWESRLGGFDLVVLNAGWGTSDPAFPWASDLKTIETNVTGFAALANEAFRRFIKRGRGHLAGVSSIAGLRGNRHASAYNASKAFVDNYLEGLRHKAAHARLSITVTTIRPGFVDTAMAKSDRVFWSAPVPKAVQQIWKGLEKGREEIVVTRRWALIAWLLRRLPFAFYRRR